MPPIALVTYDGSHPTQQDDVLLQRELVRRGHDVRIIPWSDAAVNWREFGALVIRSTWDYYKRFPEFSAWLDRVSSLPVFNPPSMIRWNLDKTYLRELRDDGVAMPRSFFGTEIAGIDEGSWVVKPLVGAGGEGVRLVSAAEARAADPKAYFVQEMISEIKTAGEISLVFIEGKFVKAVRKMPAASDFRVQEAYGGKFELLASVPDAIVEAAASIVGHISQPPLYARVDGVIRREHLVLMELELFEPELFLRMSPEIVDRFATAIEGLARRPTSPPRP